MSRRCGKGKGYRPGSIRREQLDTYKDVKAMVLSENLANGLGREAQTYLPKSLVKRLGVMTAKTGVDSHVVARIPFTRMRDNMNASIVKGRLKLKPKKSILKDNDLYDRNAELLLNGHMVKAGPLDVTGGIHSKPMVRIGTTPSRMFPMTQDGAPLVDEKGRQVFAKVPAQGKYAVVGTPNARPKDGGK